jgi:hypothetical protein
MFIEFITLAACAGAVFQASRGTTSTSAKIGMYGLISCTLVLVLF